MEERGEEGEEEEEEEEEGFWFWSNSVIKLTKMKPFRMDGWMDGWTDGYG